MVNHYMVNHSQIATAPRHKKYSLVSPSLGLGGITIFTSPPFTAKLLRKVAYLPTSTGPDLAKVQSDLLVAMSSGVI